MLLPKLPRNTAFYFYYTRNKKNVSGNPQRTPLLPPLVPTNPKTKTTSPLPFHHLSLEPTRKKKHKAHDPPHVPTCTTCTRASHPPPPSFFKTQITSPPPDPKTLSLRRSYCLCRHNNAGHSSFVHSFVCFSEKGVGLTMV